MLTDLQRAGVAVLAVLGFAAAMLAWDCAKEAIARWTRS
jgi:hypothetical protein